MPLFYCQALGEHGFLLQDRFPGLDIFVSNAFRAASDRVDRELVEYSEYARGDPVANACQMAQTLAREGGRLLDGQTAQDCRDELLKLLIGLPSWQHDLIETPT